MELNELEGCEITAHDANWILKTRKYTADIWELKSKIVVFVTVSCHG